MLLVAQSGERSWTPEAIHDTVRAVVRDPAFRRALQRTWLDRLLFWLQDLLARFGKFLRHLPSTRIIGIALVVLLVVFVAGRFIAATYASAREEDLRRTRGKAAPGDDAWLAARQLADDHRYEEAAHQLYRAVLLSVARETRVRLDPSRTSGDYVRDLCRRNSPWLNAFRTFTRRFDRAVYGHEPCDRQTFDELVALCDPFRPRAKAA
jgi:hypothetical protein